MPINLRLAKDQKTARLTFSTEPPATLVIGVVDLNTVIAQLGELRSVMLPAEPPEFVPPEPVLAIPDPPWAAEPEKLEECVLLHLRDPRFGWLSYSLPRSSAERLGTHLLGLVRRASILAAKPN